LYNSTLLTISLSGWHLVDDDSLVISLSGEIAPHGFYLLERTDDNSVSDIAADWFASFGAGGLSNSGEVLTLTDSLGQSVDTTNSGGGEWPAGSGSPGYYSMERIDPAAPDIPSNWCSNDGVVRNGLDADGGPLNGTPRAINSCAVSPDPLADLVIAKVGPMMVEPGATLTYTILLTNTGWTTATNVVVTDILPAEVMFVTQTSGFLFYPVGQHLVWELGDVLTGSVRTITFSAQLTETAVGAVANQVTATSSASETATTNNSAVWTSTVEGAQVLISAVLYDGYQSGDLDEAVQLVNTGPTAVDLTGWELCKDIGSGLGCRALPSTVVSSTDSVWLARDEFSFTLSFGFPSDHEMTSWLPYGLSNAGDEVVLRDELGVLVDVVVYKDGLTTTQGWGGAGVWPYSIGREEGQVLSRVPDETTGLPISDSDTAADWIQSTADPILGRRVLYPGWDMPSLFWPISGSEPATVVVGIAPDNAFAVVSQTIARAQQRILAEAYSLRHPEIITGLVQKARQGVSVTVLLEGSQAGIGSDDPRWQQELWGCQQIEDAGGECWFMVHDPSGRVFARYDYVHSKFLIVDDEWLLLGTQNLTVSSLPSDPKSNGTYGSRGVVLATNAPSAVGRAGHIFALDLDPGSHNDLLRWTPTLTGTYGPPVPSFTPQLTVADVVTSPVLFPNPLVLSGTYDFELLTAPEAALRQSDGLLGLVGQAGPGDAVCVEQLYEHVDWGTNPGDDPNVRLEAYIAAARRGATVRILLNGGAFGQTTFHSTNTTTVAYVNQIADTEGLDLQAAVGDPTRFGIHNKMVLVWLDDEGGYAHIGSINGSEGSSKINRELALQVGSDPVYTYLWEMFERDWRWSRPVYLPLVARRLVPPADHLLLSEVFPWSTCEWVEIHNPTPVTISLVGYRLGDAQNPLRYEGMYVLPMHNLGPGEVAIVVGDAAGCTGLEPDYEMVGSHPSVPNLLPDPFWGSGMFGLGNSGDEVLILSPSLEVVDVVAYGSGSFAGVVPHPGVDPGDGLERVPSHADTDDCSQDFRSGWSPGWVQ
jgi:uncharacterized repeat protein (TIGR01451 family)